MIRYELAPREVRWRSIGLIGASTGIAVLVAQWAWPSIGAARDFDSGIESAAAIALLGCVGWAWAVCLIGATEALASTFKLSAAYVGSDARTLGRSRRWVLAACGVVVLSGAPQTAWATTASDLSSDLGGGSATVSEVASSPPERVLDGLPMPDRATGGSVSADIARMMSMPRYTVQPGDSLWTIADQRLDDATRWSEIYEANRERIGSDPGLIHPGTVLELPR